VLCPQWSQALVEICGKSPQILATFSGGNVVFSYHRGTRQVMLTEDGSGMHMYVYCVYNVLSWSQAFTYAVITDEVCRRPVCVIHSVHSSMDARPDGLQLWSRTRRPRTATCSSGDTYHAARGTQQHCQLPQHGLGFGGVKDLLYF